MKKILGLLLVVGIASSLCGGYDNLDKYLKNAKITKKCADLYWFDFKKTAMCESLNSDFTAIEKTFEKASKLFEQEEYKQARNEDTLLGLKSKLAKHFINQKLQRSETMKNILNEIEQDELIEYDKALKKAIDQSFTDAKSKL